jgi:type IV pilus assembly protein PilQ
VLVSDEVSGTLSLNLVEVAWPDAWSTVLSAAGLAERVGQGIRFVAPAEMLAAQETQALSDAQTVEQLAPLQTVVLRVRYARANLLHKYLAAEKAGLSERGRVFVDERLNALIIRDLPGRLDSLRRLVELLDVPLSQVAIEARIVTASDSLNQQLGVAWQAAFRSAGSAGGAAKVGTGSINSVVASTALSTASPASTLSLGVLRPGVAIDARLSSLVEQGRARVLAKPKILTIDQSLASIQSGVQIPYQETSRSGATSTSFKDAVLSLHVRPQVTPDGNILMQIEVKQDTVGQIFNGVPSINTNEMQTNVLVGNGQTLVLGGILQEDENDARRKTPIFGDLPVVGRLFRRKIKRKDQQELLVFITPTLVPDSPALANLKAEALAVPE